MRECVCARCRTKDRDLLEELFVQLALLDRSTHQDTTICDTVDGPQTDCSRGLLECATGVSGWGCFGEHAGYAMMVSSRYLDGGSARCTMDERQLSKATAGRDVLHRSAVDEDVALALVDDVEVVAVRVALLDDRGAGAERDLEHDVEDVLALALLEVREEHVGAQGALEALLGLVALGHERHGLLVEVDLLDRLGRDGAAATAIARLTQARRVVQLWRVVGRRGGRRGAAAAIGRVEKDGRRAELDAVALALLLGREVVVAQKVEHEGHRLRRTIDAHLSHETLENHVDATILEVLLELELRVLGRSHGSRD